MPRYRIVADPESGDHFILTDTGDIVALVRKVPGAGKPARYDLHRRWPGGYQLWEKGFRRLRDAVEFAQDEDDHNEGASGE